MKSDKKTFYTPPRVEVVEVKNEGILCGSDGALLFLLDGGSYPAWGTGPNYGEDI